jgi:hypothetical protein
MKMQINFKSMAMIIVMILSMSLASCVQEPERDNKEQTNTSKVVCKEIDLGVEMSEDYLKLYDVKAIINIDGRIKEEVILNSDWGVYYQWKNIYPSKFNCEVIATAKSTIPEIVKPSVKIKTSKYHTCMVRYNDGNTVELVPSLSHGSVSGSFEFSSARVGEYLAKYPVVTLLKCEYDMNVE